MHNVTIYTTPSCVFCKMTKDFFETHQVQYSEKDVVSDEVAREEMMHKSHQLAVPVIDIDGNITVGFDKARLSQLLGIK